MTVLQSATSSPTTSKRHDLRTFQRYVAAFVLIVPATAVAIGRLFAVDDSGGTAKALEEIAANPDRAFTFALLGFLASLTLVPAIFAAARLARRRRPILAIIALGVNAVAYLGGYALGGLDLMYVASGSFAVEHRDGAAALIDAVWQTGLGGFSTLLFVFGHVIGTILLALALRGSIATAGWVAMLLSQPGHVVAFTVLQSPALDAAAWALMAFGFLCCAVAILRTPNDEWDLGPRA